MIRHRPAGSGHPYAADIDQRIPETPLAFEPLTLRARASRAVTSVVADVTCTPDDGSSRTSFSLPLQPTRAVLARTGEGSDGHLAAAQAQQASTAGGWQATTDPLRAGCTYTYRFTARRTDGRTERTRLFRFRAASWQRAENTAVTISGASRVIPGSVETLHDGEHAHRIRFALPLSPIEHVSGFGERYEDIDQTGSRLDCRVFEQYKSQGAAHRTYMPMPFAHVVGGDGWGFHIATSRRAWFDVGATNPGRIIVEAVTGHDGTLPVRFFDGTPTEVLSAFLDEAGRAQELPSWVFKLWASGNEWNTQAEILRQMDLHRRHDIPVGSVVIEAWSDESTFTAFRDATYTATPDGGPHALADFTFPADGAWPDPKGMVDELHSRGIRVHLWQIPLMKTRPHPAGQAAADIHAAKQNDILIQEPASTGRLRPYRNRGWWFPLALMPDLADDRSSRWWTRKRRYLVEEIGIDGFKTDGGEHAWGDDLAYHDGRRGDEANNTYPVAYAKAYGELLRSCGKPPVTFSRSGFTGSQAHGAFWAGDENSTWEAFRWSMNAGLSAAACGIVYWGWDIAGFSGEIPSAELYLRAAGASVFVPIMQYHSEYNHHRKPSRDRTPWNIAEQTGDVSVIGTFRRFAKLRERLIPYLDAQARTAVTTDRPLMRPLFFDHPHDENVWSADAQWMLGDDLLVAPVVRPGATSRNVYLPEGHWVNAWTGERHTGPLSVTVTAPIDQVPVFHRAESPDVSAALFRDPQDTGSTDG